MEHSPRPRRRPRGRRYRHALAGMLAGAVAAALPAVPAPADTPSGTSATTHAVRAAPVAAGTARTVTLVTGQKVDVRTDGAGRTSYAVRPSGAKDGGVVTWRNGGDTYALPAEALPYLGKGLDLSLFDVTALARDGLTGPAARVPVTLGFAGTKPAARRRPSWPVSSASRATPASTPTPPPSTPTPPASTTSSPAPTAPTAAATTSATPSPATTARPASAPPRASPPSSAARRRPRLLREAGPARSACSLAGRNAPPP